jgi:hypothetical protein
MRSIVAEATNGNSNQLFSAETSTGNNRVGWGVGRWGRWGDGEVGSRGENFTLCPPPHAQCPMPNAQYQMPLTKFDIDYISQKILRCGKKF